MADNQYNPQSTGQTILITQEKRKSNGIGSAGFVLALLSLFIGWIPILGWIMWILGFIFSLIGVFKFPRGLSIAGLVISLVGVILIVLVFGAIGAAAMMS